MLETIGTALVAVAAIVLIWLIGLLILSPESFTWRFKK